MKNKEYWMNWIKAAGILSLLTSIKGLPEVATVEGE